VLGYNLRHGEADGLEQLGIRGEGGRVDHDIGEEVGRAKRRVPFDLTDKLFELIQFFGGGVQIDGYDYRLTAAPGSDNPLKHLTAVKYRAGFLIRVDGNDDVRPSDLGSALGRIEAAMRSRVEVRIQGMVPRSADDLIMAGLLVAHRRPEEKRGAYDR
jgi:hypothetical protein